MARNSHFARAFTLIELIVVMAIIAILMSMVYPIYTAISERAKATKDMSNLRQIGLATQTYLNDSDGVIFSTAIAAATWMFSNYQNTLPSGSVFQSPFDNRPRRKWARCSAGQLWYSTVTRSYVNGVH